MNMTIEFDQEQAIKDLYAGIKNATGKWTKPVANWSQTLSQLAIYFDGRLDEALDI